MNSNFLNQNFYLGGYFIVKTVSRADRMNNNVLHELVLSASRCICNFYPDIDIIWSESKEKKETYRKTLMLDNHSYGEMECWINERFKNNFNFPNVFNNYESAVEFHHKFLDGLNDLRIIGIALPNKFRDIFLEEQDDLRYGVCKNLSQSLRISLEGTVLGYEILGFEYGGFHSYICNDLEDYYYDKFNFKLNDNGLISTLDEAEIFSDYTNEEIEGAEPVLWLPWVLLEYPLLKNI